MQQWRWPWSDCLTGYYAWLEKDSFMVLQRHNTIVMLLFISSNSILRLISNRPLALREQRKYLEVEEITASLCYISPGEPVPLNSHVYLVQNSYNTLLFLPTAEAGVGKYAVGRNYAERCPRTAVGRGLRGIIWTAIICSSVARLLKFAARMKIPGPPPLTWPDSYGCLIE